MNERLKELRKKLEISREEFANRLGFKSRGKIENIELGRTTPDDAFIRLICSTFNVNYSWLTAGEGQMFLENLDEDEYTRATVEIGITDPQAQQAIIEYWKLTNEDKKLFWRFINKFVSKKQEDN